MQDSWTALTPVVRRLLSEDDRATWAGTFEVVHGPGRLRRELARLCGLPAAGERVQVELRKVRLGQAVRWERTFDGRPFVTTQWEAGPGLLAERAGCLELRFRLGAGSAGARYDQVAAALRIGPLRLPLPLKLAPQVSTVARPSAPAGVAVWVGVGTPLLGLISSYSGTVVPREAED